MIISLSQINLSEVTYSLPEMEIAVSSPENTNAPTSQYQNESTPDDSIYFIQFHSYKARFSFDYIKKLPCFQPGKGNPLSMPWGRRSIDNDCPKCVIASLLSFPLYNCFYFDSKFSVPYQKIPGLLFCITAFPNSTPAGS